MPHPPNIILLVGEDTGRHLGCYGDSFARTPTLDRLAKDGCRFTNAFSTAPVCAPSRASLVTGRHPCANGTHLMRCNLQPPPPIFTQALMEAGWFVNWTNKTDFNFTPATFCHEANDWAESLASGALNDLPFFLYFNAFSTHESGLWPPGVKPPSADAPDYPDFPEPRAEDATLDNLPGLIIPPYLPDNRTTRAALVRYYDKLELQDQAWARLLAALDKSGAAENTIVIYLTDHGRGLAREKYWCYEAGIHLPLIVRAPTHLNLVEPGTLRHDLISWVDIAPTLLSLAGLPVLDPCDGRIFLGPDSQPEPDVVFAGRDRMGACFDRVRVARNSRYLYLKNDHPEIPYAQCASYYETSPVIRKMRELHARGKLNPAESLWFAPTKPEEELYDTLTDPHCLQNLAADSGHQEILLTLRQACAQWRDASHDLGRISEADLIARGMYPDAASDAAACEPPFTELPRFLDPENRYFMRDDKTLI